MATQPYREIVQQILDLNWQNLTPKTLHWLMFVSYSTAKEFAESLRIALRLYPADCQLKRMAQGELKTTNLEFNDWCGKRGDHWEFLRYWVLWEDSIPRNVVEVCRAYTHSVQQLDKEVRAMSIFSREECLAMIFAKILEAPVWNGELPIHLEAYQYYLKRHIELDTEDGGHHFLVKHYSVTEAVASFYEARLELYQAAIPELK